MRRKYKSGTVWCVWRWSDTDSEYLTRLHLLKTPWFALCLHWIHKADPEPWLHDHPVSFLSIVLRGAYAENRNGFWRNRFLWNYVKASPDDRHSILWVEPGTLTLALMGPKRREWGFHTPDGWVRWKDYYAAQRASA